jgi:hypothetical protein
MQRLSSADACATMQRVAASEATGTEGEAPAPPGAARRGGWLRGLERWLANPFVVTVAAALLINWVIPSVTRKWQDHQKALEIKTGLVGDMSESVASAVSTGRFLASGLIARASADSHAEQRAWNAGYRDWTTTSSAIGARLQAYLPDDTGAQWRGFANVVTDFLLVSTHADPSRTAPSRVAQVEEIYRYRSHLSVRPTPEGWITLARQSSGDAFQRAYATLAQGILARRDELVSDVLASPVSGF